MARLNRSCKDQPRIPSWREIRAVYERRRRVLRQALLEPILVGWPVLRQVFTNALAARGHLVLCDLGDVRFFVDPSDRVVGAWLMWHGGWQRREIDTAVNVLTAAGRLHKDAVFIDVGAHIGTHTVYALRSGRFIRAVAFEPEPRNARLLAMNLEMNGFSQTAVVVQKAAGAAAGNALLHLHPRNTGAHAVESPPSLDGQVALEVPMVRVDEELHALGIAPNAIGLIWIDAEGYEPQVLDGLAGLVSRSVPLAFEFTPSRYSAEKRQQLLARLVAHYSSFQSLGRRDASGPIAALASHARTDDVLVF
jgi:FkbM family methyltransferase